MSSRSCCRRSSYLGGQCLLGLWARRHDPEALDTARLLFAAAAVIWMSVGSGNPATLPLASLVLPIIVMAAALGTRQSSPSGP